MGRSLRIVKWSICTVLSAACSMSFAATPAEVDASLEKAKAYLYSVQSPDGTWEAAAAPTDPKRAQSALGGQFSGATALNVYALLSAGEKASNPKLERAIEFLKKTDTLGTYALGLRCQVWLMLPQTPEVKSRMQKDVQVLLRTPRTQGNAQGMYDYTFDKGNAYSHSRAQYAVLGIWAAERAGQRIPEGYWPVTERAWIRNQDPNGGWTYMHPSDTKYSTTPGMTAAGVATLFITQDYVHANAGALCRGNVDSPAITKGMEWMAANMDKVATDKSYDRDFPYPTLYAVERIGVAAGVKYIGGVDWYQKGADWLLKKQGKSGSWSGTGIGTGAPHQNTAFAMLFLARGRAPLVMNKLDYSTDPAKPAAWNQRPRDVANVVRWIST
ncbi:MAG TPA: prenyltransferase/squalene oxidase repeat-containing protein, partial [Tepidisphaeraceae bacterium]|nr:prenyltransferase/squalene oxidase repeat-containing protein [Tepidisphaeraceae bacterium]